MGGSIRLYGGNKAAMPRLREREPGFCTDTGELYMGTEGGNVLLCSRESASGVFDALTLKSGGGDMRLSCAGGRLTVGSGGGEKSAAYVCRAVSPLAADADISRVIAAFNGLLSAMRASGTMEE